MGFSYFPGVFPEFILPEHVSIVRERPERRITICIVLIEDSVAGDDDPGDGEEEGEETAAGGDDTENVDRERDGEDDDAEEGGEDATKTNTIISTANVGWWKPANVAQEAGLSHCVDAAVDGVGDDHHDEEGGLAGVGVDADHDLDDDEAEEHAPSAGEQSCSQLEFVSKDCSEDDEDGQGEVASDAEVAGEVPLHLSEAGVGGVPGPAGVSQLVVPEVCHGDQHHVGEHQGHAVVVEEDPEVKF